MIEFLGFRRLLTLWCLLALATCKYQAEFNYRVPAIPEHLQEVAEDFEWASGVIDEYKPVINIFFIEDEQKMLVEISYILWKLYSDCPQFSCVICWDDDDPDCEKKHGILDVAVYVSLRVRSWCKTVMEEIEVGLMDVESFYLRKAFEVENHIIAETSFAEYNSSRICIRKLVSSYLLPNYAKPIDYDWGRFEKLIREAIDLGEDDYDEISNQTVALELCIILFVLLILVASYFVKREFYEYKRLSNLRPYFAVANDQIGLNLVDLN